MRAYDEEIRDMEAELDDVERRLDALSYAPLRPMPDTAEKRAQLRATLERQVARLRLQLLEMRSLARQVA